MGLREKEARLYNAGMRDAILIVKSSGIEMAEYELNQRLTNKAPAGVSSFVIKNENRKKEAPELEVISVALAHTIIFDTELTPSEIKHFLKRYNDLCDKYRADAEMMEAHKVEISKKPAINEMCMHFLEEK